MYLVSYLSNKIQSFNSSASMSCYWLLLTDWHWIFLSQIDSDITIWGFNKTKSLTMTMLTRWCLASIMFTMLLIISKHIQYIWHFCTIGQHIHRYQYISSKLMLTEISAWLIYRSSSSTDSKCWKQTAT